jgi:hypothetical protein
MVEASQSGEERRVHNRLREIRTELGEIADYFEFASGPDTSIADRRLSAKRRALRQEKEELEELLNEI